MINLIAVFFHPQLVSQGPLKDISISVDVHDIRLSIVCDGYSPFDHFYFARPTPAHAINRPRKALKDLGQRSGLPAWCSSYTDP